MTLNREGREARFDQVLEDHGPALWRMTLGYAREEADRHDLYQDILIAIWRALPRFESRSSVKTFVYRIAYNRGVSFRARRGRHRHESLDVQFSDPAPNPAESLDKRLRRERLEEAIRSLPHNLRQAIMLRLDGFTNPEIADVVGISEANAAVRVSRAKKALEDLL